MAKGERKNETIGVLDFETDPFRAGRIPLPFAACVYFGPDDFSVLWEADSSVDFIERTVRAIRRLPACVLYAHNGGRFDFHYLLEFANPGTVQIRNGRVAQCNIGRVTLKDSFPLMPFPLDEYKKDEIDYAIFERRRRNVPENRRRICDYLIGDCRYLLELLMGFREVVGKKDTIGSAAFSQMRRMGIEIQSMSESHDAMFRPFYFGGRVQAFKRGILRGPFQYLDINSAYPRAMMEQHAHGAEYDELKRLPKRDLGPCFVRCIAESDGALPLREENGKLLFPDGEHEFYATGWELLAGVETKTLKIRKVIECWRPRGFITFREYVEHFYKMRLTAKQKGDIIRALAYKYLLNSGYGKFAQNPRDFKEYVLAPFGKNVPGYDWENDFGAISLWSKPNYQGFGYFDVATGASITGYVRAMLWRAIRASREPIYCDTDALICRASSVPRGDALGEWKLEGIVKRAAIAGKKLYGVEWSDGEIKIASKGARLSWSDMLRLCNGHDIIWENDAPTFSVGGASFITRRITATV